MINLLAHADTPPIGGCAPAARYRGAQLDHLIGRLVTT